jgi:Xaa-Pro aminopeptidase
MKKAENTHFSRQRRLAAALGKERLPALLVTNLINIRYLTGFHCSYGYLLVFPKKAYLLTDARYASEARAVAAVDEVVEIKTSRAAAQIGEILGDHRVSRLGFEPEALTVADFETLKNRLTKIKWIGKKQLVEGIRLVKDDSEIECIKNSSRIMDRAFKNLLGFIKPGVTETAIRAELESYLIKQNIEGLSFETIAASGPRGAFAHGHPSKKKVRAGEFVVLDFGVCTDGYHSDITRTVFVGKPQLEDIFRYRAVQIAQQKAFEASAPGAAASFPDSVARETLKKFKLDDCFTHGLGHGVGMEVHERPRLSAANGEKLRAGMVFTIEPGIYIEGWGGVRIEDTVVMTAGGPVRLTRSPRSLIAL